MESEPDKINIANAITIGAGILGVSGIYDIYHNKKIKGLTKLAFSRGADALDGSIARKLNQETVFGNKADHIIDTGFALALPYVIEDEFEMPKQIAGLMALRHFIKILQIIPHKSCYEELVPTKEGKLAATGEFSALGMFALSNILKEHNHEQSADILKNVAAGLSVASFALGVVGMIKMQRDINKINNHNKYKQ